MKGLRLILCFVFGVCCVEYIDSVSRIAEAGMLSMILLYLTTLAPEDKR